MATEKRYWQGSVPPADDFMEPIVDEFVDGKTIMGPWAMMAPASFAKLGIGVAQGSGQRYKKQRDGRWLKVGG